MTLDNLNISKKLAVGFAVVVTVVTVMCVALFLSIQAFRAAVADGDESSDQLSVASQALNILVERQNAVRGLVASGDPSFVKKIADQSKAFDDIIVHWAKIAPEDAALVASVKATGL